MFHFHWISHQYMQLSVKMLEITQFLCILHEKILGILWISDQDTIRSLLLVRSAGKLRPCFATNQLIFTEIILFCWYLWEMWINSMWNYSFFFDTRYESILSENIILSLILTDMIQFNLKSIFLWLAQLALRAMLRMRFAYNKQC